MTRSTFLKGLTFYIANNWVANIPSFRVRHWYYRRILRYTLGRDSSIHMGTFVTGMNIHIGDNVVINRKVYLDGRIGVRLGNNISISPEAYLVSMEHDPNDPHFSTRGAEIVVDDNAWIGARAMIMPGIHIGEGAVIAAGAVVTKNVEPYQIVGGVPARPIGVRSRQIEYRVKYFPWFDSDIQREQENVPAAGSGLLHRAFSLPARFIRLVREQGFMGALRRVRERLWSRPQPPPPVLDPKEALAYFQPPGSEVRISRQDKTRPRVSILVLTYNNLLLNKLCLHSIYRNTMYPNYEIVVVDNASSDGTPGWLQEFAAGRPEVKLILNQENRGFAAGNNQAARAATGDYLVFLNNDTIVTPGWVEHLIAYLEADPQIGLVGPVTNSTGNEARIPVTYSNARGLEEFAVERGRTMASQCFDIRSLAMYCVMARREQFFALGALDERFGVGMFEDEDLAVRYQQAGLRVVCAEDAFVHHFWRAAFGKLEQERYEKIFSENRRKFEEKWGREWQPYKSRYFPPAPASKPDPHIPVSSKSKLLWILPLIVLISQNLVIFSKHYFNDYGFPWDFGTLYYAMTAFWTSLWSQGVFPSWVPFHFNGIPFDLLVQSGSHYPPLWIFPLLKIQYSLHAAVVFQCLHVALGAVGMYFFLKEALPQGRYKLLYAALGAFIFQFFGGFYSNAEHVDIIRAFALTPWLFYFFYLKDEKPYISFKRLVFIPWIVLLFVTGAYAGNLFSGALIIGLFFVLQLARLWRGGVSLRGLLTLSMRVGIFIALGAAMSLYHLGPATVFGGFLARSVQLGKLQYQPLGMQQFPALFLTNRLVPGEISMTSSYMTLPALVILTYLPLSRLKEKWPFSGVLLASLLLLGGPGSFVWYLLGRFIPLYRSSRFPASDYRAIVIILLIFFSMLAAKYLLEGTIRWREFMVRTGIAFAWFTQGIYMAYPSLRDPGVFRALAIFLATLLIIFLLVLAKRQNLASYPRFGVWGVVLALFILSGVDAARVLSDMYNETPQSTWQVPEFSSYYESWGWHLLKEGRLLSYEIPAHMPESRPVRIEKTSFMDYGWEGFITGRYTFSPQTRPIQLRSDYFITDHPSYIEYMLREWLPLFFHPDEYQPVEDQIQIPPAKIASSLSNERRTSGPQVLQVHYGMDTIEYKVSLPQPALMVENEPWFPGWTADLQGPQGTERIQAMAVNEIFRAWYLPAGNYSMKAQFVLPGDRLFKGISLGALGLWSGLVLYMVLQRRSRRSA